MNRVVRLLADAVRISTGCPAIVIAAGACATTAATNAAFNTSRLVIFFIAWLKPSRYFHSKPSRYSLSRSDVGALLSFAVHAGGVAPSR